MDSSLQGIMLSSLGGGGSCFLTGTGTWTSTRPWIAFRTAATGIAIAAITAPSVSGVNYITGRTLNDPYEFLGSFTSIRLGTGAIQAFY